MAKINQITEVEVDRLRPYGNNAKVHSERQVEQIAASIEEFGFLNPCLIDKELNIIAGHGRVLAAKKLGRETVPCIYIEGLTEEQRRAYILADNKLTELGGWDPDLVSQELEALKGSGFDINITGFSIDDIIFTEDEEPQTWEEIEAELDTENVPEVHRGELWKLGEHYLMCGDSTDPAAVARLMQGEKADLLVTDPPYNVALGVGDTPEVAKERRRRIEGKIKNDNMSSSDIFEFLVAAIGNAYEAMKPGAAYYCWYGNLSQKTTQTALEEVGLPPHEVLIWVKNILVLGRNDYHWRHEPCFYGWKEGAAHYFIDVRSFSTILDNTEQMTREQAIEALKNICDITTTLYADRPMKSELHPTMKPVPLIKKLIRNSSREGDLVLDLFGGSGTTLVASEEMQRRCRMMELDEHFCGVIIQRWEQATGRKAERCG